MKRTMEPEDSSKDLPLLANVDDILVCHYMLHLECDLNAKTFSSCCILFLKPTLHSITSNEDGSVTTCFELVLDCCDISVLSVKEILHDELEFNRLLNSDKQYEFMSNWLSKPMEYLRFRVTKWGLYIWKVGVHSKYQFPSVVAITYQTKPCGASLTWACDQSSNLCVFTQGAWINNRALFPCQEPPTAMATWEACIIVPKDYAVIMSGDEHIVVDCQDKSKAANYFSTTMSLPMSTLAIAVGAWKQQTLASKEESFSSRTECNLCDFECLHDDYTCYLKQNLFPSLLLCRLFSPTDLLPGAVQEFGSFLRACLKAAFGLLGPHPFSRLDVVILPRCFGSLGLSSPNVLFISQSLLASDGSMNKYLAHEIAHSWFGLSIGALDWTEEWLSEGFATFMEDYIYAEALKLTSEECRQCSNLHAILRYNTLCCEIENTKEELQTLRPNAGAAPEKNGKIMLVKNGMEAEKCFMQVHYIKGYLLLKYMASLVGDKQFLSLLKDYVTKFHGQLVVSKGIFTLFSENFPSICEIQDEFWYSNWLDKPNIPQSLKLFQSTFANNNQLVKEVMDELAKWKAIKRSCQQRNTGKRRKRIKLDFIKLAACQLVYLLELLLKESKISIKMLRLLNQEYNFAVQNADVRHRWCELIIQFKFLESISDVRRFLLDDQAMGVFLYGELIIAGQKELAESCFRDVKDEMDAPALSVVKDLLSL